MTTPIEAIVFDYLETCSTQAEYLDSIGEEAAAQLVFTNGVQVAAGMDTEELLTMTYWRYESESYGAVTEQDFDEELRFGGVL